MKNIFNFLRKDKIGEPPYLYNFLANLPESEYPKYLKKIYKYKTGENLNLKHPKTFNEKIQWIKLYGVTPLMRDCTDKVKVRDFVKERIGEEYLKPVLQIIPNESKETMRCHCEQVNDNSGLARQSTDGSNDKMDCRADIKMTLSARNDGELDDVSTYFDKIDFDKLPNSFVIKTNHGCKWQYIIKDKNEFLNTPKLIEIVKNQITGWLEQDYSFFNGFEMQYGNISPKILIEPLLRNEINTPCKQIQTYCFNGVPKFIIYIHNNSEITLYDGNFNIIEDFFEFEEEKRNIEADNFTKQSFDLSIKLLNKTNFHFVRVDLMIYKNKLYFEELTFTPYSGFYSNIQKNNDIKLGRLLQI